MWVSAVAEDVVVRSAKVMMFERRAVKGVNKPGPERSGGVQLAEVTKQDKKKEGERRQRSTTTR